MQKWNHLTIEAVPNSWRIAFILARDALGDRRNGIGAKPILKLWRMHLKTNQRHPKPKLRSGEMGHYLPNLMKPFELADALNHYFQVGCKTFTRHELLAYGGADRFRVENCLRAWESRGFIQVLKSLDEAHDGEIVVKLLHPINDQDNTAIPV